MLEVGGEFSKESFIVGWWIGSSDGGLVDPFWQLAQPKPFAHALHRTTNMPLFSKPVMAIIATSFNTSESIWGAEMSHHRWQCIVQSTAPLRPMWCLNAKIRNQNIHTITQYIDLNVTWNTMSCYDLGKCFEDPRFEGPKGFMYCIWIKNKLQYFLFPSEK